MDCNDKLGLVLTEVIKKGNSNKRLLISHDLLKKMGHNFSMLSQINTLDHSAASKNIIYRGVILDLMTALFLLHITEEEFDYSIKLLDISHVKYMKEVLPLRLELGRRIFHPNENEDIEEQVLFDQYFEHFREYLDSRKGEPWRIIRIERPIDFVFDGTVKSLYIYLKMCDENENLQALSNLYIYYKYLSQTEHYSFLGNRYPFKNDYDGDWNNEFNIAIYAGIIEMESLIEAYY